MDMGGAMTKTDISRLLATMQALYPSFHPADMKAAINVWHSVLSDVDGTLMGLALKEYASEPHQFAPSPGELISIITDKLQESPMTEMEAWAAVSKALGNSIYGSKEEFDKLPEAVQIAVGDSENLRQWAMLEAESMSVIQSQFLRAYRAAQERTKKQTTDKLIGMDDSLKQLMGA